MRMPFSTLAPSVVLLLACSVCAIAQSPKSVQEFRDLMAQAEREYDHVECRAKWTHYAPHDRVQQVDELNVFMVGRYCVTEQTALWSPSGRLPRPLVVGSNARYRFELESNGDAW